MVITQVPERLRNARYALGFSRRQVAEKAGISEATIYNLETGRVVPRGQTVYALARVLGLDPGELLAGERAS